MIPFRRPFFAGLALVVVALASGVGLSILTDPEHVKPDHVARPTAGASAPLPLAAVGGDSTAALEREYVAWIEGIRVEQERLAAEEAERVAAAERARREQGARSGAGTGGSFGGDCAAMAAEFGLPESILWRESRCSYDAFNARGCGGRGCVGPSQTDLGHYEERSPWGGPGGCRDLDPWTVEGQVECTRRLSSDGTNLDPWR